VVRGVLSRLSRSDWVLFDDLLLKFIANSSSWMNMVFVAGRSGVAIAWCLLRLWNSILSETPY
jgi:hypothetical protein